MTKHILTPEEKRKQNNEYLLHKQLLKDLKAAGNNKRLRSKIIQRLIKMNKLY